MIYTLPTEFRDELREAIGEITDGAHIKEKLKGKIVSVGDEVTLTLKNRGIEPDICIVDYKSRRKECSPEEKSKIQKIGEKVYKVTNPPKKISKELWEGISKAYSSKKVIK